MRLRCTLLGYGLLACAIAAQAQEAAPPVHFEVVSIKQTPSDDQHHSLNFERGRVLTRNLTLRDLVKYAYDLKSDSQVVGAPEWTKTVGFSLDATEDPALDDWLMKMSLNERQKNMRAMFREVLAERFHLSVVQKQVELPVYALVVAKGGPRVTPAPKDAERRFRGWQTHGPGDAEGASATMALTATVLSQLPEADGRVVIDKTEMPDEYDFHLKWKPVNDVSATEGPSLFTALEEQMGLRLESQKAMVDAVVVEKVEKPTEN